MKAYVLNGIGQLDYMEVKKPELKSGWVLVEVGAAGICESDIPRIFKTGTYHFPTIPGHEFAGKVVEVFDKEAEYWLGKRVGVFPLIPCKECFVCKDEKYEMCRNYDYMGSRRDGGFAEYVAVPVWNLIELPDAMPMDAAAMLEPASVARHAVKRLEITPEDTVALFGLGTIGIIITQWLHILGVKKVYAIGHHPEHGEAMKQTASTEYEYFNDVKKAADEGKHKMQQSAEAWLMERTGGKGVTIAIDCVGSSSVLTTCLNCVRPGGQVLTVGNPRGDVALEKAVYWKILRNQIRLTGTWNSSFTHDAEDDWNQVMKAVCDGTLKLSELITHRLAFDELEKGLLIARDRLEYRNKIMIFHPEMK